jgi:hypothetical protein
MAVDYKSFLFALSTAVQTAIDIADNKGLRTGGEQYPNALNAIEAHATLKQHLDRREEPDADLNALSSYLKQLWDTGEVDLEDMRRVAIRAMEKHTPTFFTPKESA